MYRAVLRDLHTLIRMVTHYQIVPVDGLSNFDFILSLKSVEKLEMVL
jgi:hypothetical protein